MRDMQSAMHLLKENVNSNDYTVKNSDGSKQYIIKEGDLTDWSGDIEVNSNDPKYNVMLYWNEDKGYDYIEHIYRMDEEGEIVNKFMNLSPNEPMLITLPDNEYNEFIRWIKIN